MRRNYPDAFIEYMVHFHGDRDFFECHEILEEYWKKDQGDPYRHLWHGLIQLAVGLYHHRRGNIAGARKMIDSAVTRLSDYRLFELGIDAAKLMPALREYARSLKQDPAPPPYTEFNIPFSDPDLERRCREAAQRAGMSWKEGAETAAELLHKHTQRDRSGVVEERRRMLEHRRTKKGLPPT